MCLLFLFYCLDHFIGESTRGALVGRGRGETARELSYCVLIKNVPFHLFKLFNKLASCDGGRAGVNSAKLYLR